MDEQRLADVRAGADEKAVSSGSGYLVGPSLVLTAMHVVIRKCGRCGESGMCEKCRPWTRIQVRVGHPSYGVPVRVPGEVCWQNRDCDLALIRIDSLPVPDSPVRWGWAVGAGDLEYKGLGFPLFAGYDDRHRFVEPLTGHFNPLSKTPEGYALNQTNAPVVDLGKNPLWKGVSGAAVFSGGLLVGVVTKDDQRFAGRRLRAVPTHPCVNDPDFIQLIKTDTWSVPMAEPVELVAWLDGRFREPEAPEPISDTAVELVNRTDQEKTIKRLGKWRDSGSKFAVTLITGDARQNRIRLGRELTRVTQEVGWVTGFIASSRQSMKSDEQNRQAYELAALIRSSTEPLLLVCDDAETRTVFVSKLASELQIAPPKRQVRLLLTSGTVDAWWNELAESLHGAASGYRLTSPGEGHVPPQEGYLEPVRVEMPRQPLISLVRKTVIINVYDRQIAMEMIRELGATDE